MSEWKREGEERSVTGPEGVAWVRYLRGPGNEGAHEVHVGGGHTLTMLPDSRTSARKRTGLVSVAVEGKRDLMATLIGLLVMSGATNLLWDGEPLIPEAGGRWVVELADAGEVKMRYVEGERDDQGAREFSEGTATRPVGDVPQPVVLDPGSGG